MLNISKNGKRTQNQCWLLVMPHDFRFRIFVYAITRYCKYGVCWFKHRKRTEATSFAQTSRWYLPHVLVSSIFYIHGNFFNLNAIFFFKCLLIENIKICEDFKIHFFTWLMYSLQHLFNTIGSYKNCAQICYAQGNVPRVTRFYVV